MAPWRWICRKLSLLTAHFRSFIREYTHWNEHAYSIIDDEDNNRTIWIGTCKGTGVPTIAVTTYYGKFQKE